MKKINYVALDASTLRILRECLQKEKAEAAAEFNHGLEALLLGQADAMMLELQENPEMMIWEEGLSCGELVIRPKCRRVTLAGREVQLTPKEFDILYFLARNRGEVFTKEQIYQAIWSEDYFTTDSNIMAFIRKLRRKIEPNPDEPQYILTIWGVGYKFNDQI